MDVSNLDLPKNLKESLFHEIIETAVDLLKKISMIAIELERVEMGGDELNRPTSITPISYENTVKALEVD